MDRRTLPNGEENVHQEGRIGDEGDAHVLGVDKEHGGVAQLKEREPAHVEGEDQQTADGSAFVMGKGNRSLFFVCLHFLTTEPGLPSPRTLFRRLLGLQKLQYLIQRRSSCSLVRRSSGAPS